MVRLVVGRTLSSVSR